MVLNLLALCPAMGRVVMSLIPSRRKGMAIGIPGCERYLEAVAGWPEDCPLGQRWYSNSGAWPFPPGRLATTRGYVRNRSTVDITFNNAINERPLRCLSRTSLDWAPTRNFFER